MNIILFEGETIPAELSRQDERARHILKILRLTEGDTFRCGLVNGPSGICRIERITAEALSLFWEKTADKKALYPVTLLVGYTRPISSKRILREAASLGVERIIFTGTDTGERSYRVSNLWKTGEYRKYLTDGAQQAGSTAVPGVLFFPDVVSVLEAVHPGTGMTGAEMDLVVLDNVHSCGRMSEYTPPRSSVLLAIGSERGWSDRERELFSKRGFISLSLGERILRTETACSAGLAVLLARMGCI